jgi:hypothetical protein
LVQAVTERWADPERVLRPSPKSYAAAHVAAVRNIAEEYFGYPTPDLPHFRTFVNHPEPEQKVFTNFGRELTPDIVVLEWPERLPRIFAEVVTQDMLTDENAEMWWVLSRLKDVTFFLYVPAGAAAMSKRLLKKHNIKNIRLRTWRHITGLKTIDVAPIK